MKVKVKSLSSVRLFTTAWTAADQGPPSMGFSRQEYWSGLPLPSPREELMSIILKLLNMAEEGILPNSFYKAIITMILKPDKDNTKKKITGQYH